MGFVFVDVAAGMVSKILHDSGRCYVPNAKQCDSYYGHISTSSWAHTFVVLEWACPLLCRTLSSYPSGERYRKFRMSHFCGARRGLSSSMPHPKLLPPYIGKIPMGTLRTNGPSHSCAKRMQFKVHAQELVEVSNIRLYRGSWTHP